VRGEVTKFLGKQKTETKKAYKSLQINAQKHAKVTNKHNQNKTSKKQQTRSSQTARNGVKTKKAPQVSKTKKHTVFKLGDTPTQLNTEPFAPNNPTFTNFFAPFVDDIFLKKKSQR
jgi:hypothetical protein